MNRCCCCCCCCWAPSIVSIRVCTVAAVQFFSSHQPFPIIPKNSQTRNVCTAHAHTQCRNEQKNIRAAHAAWSKIYYWVFVELGRRAENMWKHTHQIVCSPQALCHHSTSEHRDRHIERTGELRKKKQCVLMPSGIVSIKSFRIFANVSLLLSPNTWTHSCLSCVETAFIFVKLICFCPAYFTIHFYIFFLLSFWFVIHHLRWSPHQPIATKYLQRCAHISSISHYISVSHKRNSRYLPITI